MKMGVSGDELKRTILAYNKAATKGFDDQFGKPAHWMRPVKGPNYYAFKLEAEHYAAGSGVAVDQSLHVLDRHDRPITGLYAARVGIGSIGSIGGVADGTFTIWTDTNAFGWSVYSGRKAALEALKGAKEARQAATDKAVREE